MMRKSDLLRLIKDYDDKQGVFKADEKQIKLLKKFLKSSPNEQHEDVSYDEFVKFLKKKHPKDWPELINKEFFQSDTPASRLMWHFMSSSTFYEARLIDRDDLEKTLGVAADGTIFLCRIISDKNTLFMVNPDGTELQIASFKKKYQFCYAAKIYDGKIAYTIRDTSINDDKIFLYFSVPHRYDPNRRKDQQYNLFGWLDRWNFDDPEKQVGLSALTVSLDGCRLIASCFARNHSGRESNFILIHDMVKGERINKWYIQKPNKSICVLTPLPNKCFASGGSVWVGHELFGKSRFNGKITIWTEKGKIIREINEPSHGLVALPGENLLSCKFHYYFDSSEDKQYHREIFSIWDIRTGDCLRSWEASKIKAEKVNVHARSQSLTTRKPLVALDNSIHSTRLFYDGQTWSVSPYFPEVLKLLVTCLTKGVSQPLLVIMASYLGPEMESLAKALNYSSPIPNSDEKHSPEIKSDSQTSPSIPNNDTSFFQPSVASGLSLTSLFSSSVSEKTNDESKHSKAKSPQQKWFKAIKVVLNKEIKICLEKKMAHTHLNELKSVVDEVNAVSLTLENSDRLEKKLLETAQTIRKLRDTPSLDESARMTFAADYNRCLYLFEVFNKGLIPIKESLEAERLQLAKK